MRGIHNDSQHTTLYSWCTHSTAEYTRGPRTEISWNISPSPGGDFNPWSLSRQSTTLTTSLSCVPAKQTYLKINIYKKCSTQTTNTSGSTCIHELKRVSRAFWLESTLTVCNDRVLTITYSLRRNSLLEEEEHYRNEVTFSAHMKRLRDEAGVLLLMSETIDTLQHNPVISWTVFAWSQ